MTRNVPPVKDITADMQIRIDKMIEASAATDVLIQRVNEAELRIASISADYRVALVSVAESFMKSIVAVSETYASIVTDSQGDVSPENK